MKSLITKAILTSTLVLSSLTASAYNFSWPETVDDSQEIYSAINAIPSQIEYPEEGEFYEVRLAEEVWNKAWPIINNYHRNPNVNEYVAFMMLELISLRVNLDGSWVCSSGNGASKIAGKFNYHVSDIITVQHSGSTSWLSPNLTDIKATGSQTISCGWRSSNN